jgi:hypothetical protein
MPKLTIKTTKEGQKCVLTTKTPLFYNYKKIRIGDHHTDQIDTVENAKKMPNISYFIYNTEYVKTKNLSKDINKKFIERQWDDTSVVFSDKIHSAVQLEEGQLNHISPTILKEMKKKCDVSKLKCGVGEIKPIIPLDKGTEIEVTKLSHCSHI